MLGVYDYTVVLTYVSVLISMGGMLFSLNGCPKMAVVCLAVSGFCDMFDGKIARTKKNRTEVEKRFGIQIDSLADIICFGVAPSLIAYRMGMNHIVGIAILMFYVLAGLIRLAWFNVSEEIRQNETEENRECYQGLPITSMAIALPILVVFRPLLSPIVSRIGGAFLNTRISKLGIRPFVKSNGIDLSIYEKQEFASYNEFFTRKIRAAERPADMRENVLISPSDGKVSVYPIEENGIFRIKHTPYTVRQLLRDDKLADRYMGGWIYVIRLTVDDYHRYCYVSDGYRSSGRRIEGVLHTVNPVANDCYPIYKMNTREYCLLKTRKLGTVLTMEVGALMVGKICNYVKQPCEVHRGEEKGRFEFGGSTIIVMTEPGKVIPDQDLRTNTREHAETLVKMGEHIGAQIEQ